MNNVLVEGLHGHGAVPPSLVKRTYRRVFRPLIGQASVPFDWSVGFDLEDKVALSRKNQGESFSCAGQAGSYFLEAQRKLKGIQEVISAKSIYSPIHYKNGGATVDSMETQISLDGGNLESDVPSYENGQTPTEQFMEDTSWKNEFFYHDAMKRAGFTPHRVSADIESIAEAIRDYDGVIVMVTGQNNGTWLSAYPVPPDKNNANGLWNHYLFLKGAKMINGKKYLLGLNSW